MTARREVSYDVCPRKIAGDGGVVLHAMLACSRCDAREFVNLKGRAPNPRAVVKDFIALGWECERENRHRTLCPECIQKRSDGRRGESGKKEPPMTIAHGNVTTITPGAANGQPRNLTTEERFAVRRLLDTHFDDGKGFYLNGYSDQRIGAEANVPWAAVAKLREAAYGALKSNPELDSIEQGIDQLKVKLTSLDIIVIDARKVAEAALKTAEAARARVEEAERVIGATGDSLSKLVRDLGETRRKLGIG